MIVERIVHTVPQRRISASIEALDPNDVGYVRATWRETHHQSPGKRRMSWRDYKATHGKAIDALLSRPDVWIQAAYDKSRRVLAWIAYTPGRVGTLHYLFVRFEARKQELGLRMIKAAGLGSSFIYTHKGARPRSSGSPSFDTVMAEALSRRGVAAAYVPIAEWNG